MAGSFISIGFRQMYTKFVDVDNVSTFRDAIRMCTRETKYYHRVIYNFNTLLLSNCLTKRRKFCRLLCEQKRRHIGYPSKQRILQTVDAQLFLNLCMYIFIYQTVNICKRSNIFHTEFACLHKSIFHIRKHEAHQRTLFRYTKIPTIYSPYTHNSQYYHSNPEYDEQHVTWSSHNRDCLTTIVYGWRVYIAHIQDKQNCERTIIVVYWVLG